MPNKLRVIFVTYWKNWANKMSSIRYVGRIISFGIKTVKLIKNWSILFSYYKKTNNEIKIKLRNDLEFYSNGDIADLVVIIEIFGNESNYDYFIKKNPNKIKTIIDIGANIGIFGIFSATKYPNSTVYCFEPDKMNFQTMIKNFELNKIKNVRFFNQAVGKINGEIQLYAQEDGNFGTANSSTTRVGSKSVSVECITLETLFHANSITECDLLKFDCEGAEYEILFNTNPDFFSKIKNISIEYHNLENSTGSDLETFLKKLGYEVKILPTKRNLSIGYIYAQSQ